MVQEITRVCLTEFGTSMAVLLVITFWVVIVSSFDAVIQDKSVAIDEQVLHVNNRK